MLASENILQRSVNLCSSHIRTHFFHFLYRFLQCFIVVTFTDFKEILEFASETDYVEKSIFGQTLQKQN